MIFLKQLLFSSLIVGVASFRLSNIYLRHIRNERTLLLAMPRPVGIQLPDLSQKSFPELPPEDEDGCSYDLVVIGSGPAGEAAAVRAAKLGARVAVIEKKAAFGGPTGLTSKAVREAAKRICAAIDQIGGDRRRQVKGLWKRKYPILKTEAEVLQAQESRSRLAANNIDLFIGTAKLVPKNERFDSNFKAPVVRVCRPTTCADIMAKHVCIATGSRPHRPKEIAPGSPLQFRKGKVICANEFANLIDLPTAAAIIGGGVIAVEYATVLAKLGVGVSLLCSEKSFLPFLEDDLRTALYRRLAKDRVLIVHEPIREIIMDTDEVTNTTSVRVALNRLSVAQDDSPTRKNLPERRLKVDLLLYSGGRDANSEGLGLESVGVATTKFGRISVDSSYRTTGESSIFAVGDVIGPPGLASAAAQQARLVADSLFGSFTDHIEEETDDVLRVSQSDNEDNGYDDEYGGLEEGGGDDAAFFRVAAPVLDQEALDHTSSSSTLFGSEVPLTLWTVPEIASVGLSTKQATSQAQLQASLASTALQGAGRETGAGPGSGPTAFTSTAVGTAAQAGQTAGRSSDDDAAVWAAKRVVELSLYEEDGLVEGFAYFKDMARGRLSGDLDGFLKIVARKKKVGKMGSKAARFEHTILGVHIFGEGANELVQLGSILVHSGATIEQVSRTPFAAVTLSGLYQMACDDAIAKSASLAKQLMNQNHPTNRSP